MTTATFTPEQSAALSRLRSVRDDMTTALVGREREIDGLCLSLLANAHTLFIGVPGTAKSLMATEFARAIGLDPKSEDYFEILLGAFSNPDEVFGPYNPAKILDGVYERNVDGYLPTAQFGFMDEIFNASQEMLTTLNTILNERRMKQGTQRLDCPLRMVVGAANVYPQGDLALAALYDRFLLRFWTPYVETREDKRRLLRIARDGGVKFSQKLDDGDVEIVRAACDAVHVPDELLDLLVDVEFALRDEGVVVSDRRSMAQVKLVKARAALDGRAVATARDLFVLADSVWDTHEQRPVVWKTIAKIVDSSLLAARALFDAVLVEAESVDLQKRDEANDTRRPAKRARAALNAKIADAMRSIESLPGVDTSDEQIATMLAKLANMKRSVARSIARLDMRLPSAAK